MEIDGFGALTEACCNIPLRGKCKKWDLEPNPSYFLTCAWC